MNEIHSIPEPGELRRFGFLFAAILALLFGLLIPLFRFGLGGLPLLEGNHNPAWPWLAGLLISAWAIVLPASLHLLYRPWMKFAQIMQWINTRIILLILFYIVILPIGLLRRMLGKDSMQRKFDNSAKSYRTIPGEADKNDMEKPF